MENIKKIIFLIIGALIGAGFASGQEIYIFFYSYGIWGIYGIIISSIIVGIIIYKTLSIINKKNITTYKDFLRETLNCNNNKIEIVNIVIKTFILITFFIMIAGFGAYFEQEYKINRIIGSSILAILCYIVLNKNIKGVIKANEILTPLLIIIITIIGFLNIKTIDIKNIKVILNQQNNFDFFIKAIIYSSYNSVLLIPVLVTTKKYLTGKKQIIKISIISCLLIIILSITVFLILTKVDINIKTLEMPALYVVSNFFENSKKLYGIVILGAIFTTAISLGLSFLGNTLQKNTKEQKQYKAKILLMCVLSVIISKIGFSNLISLFYSIFGCIGIIQIIKILLF